MNDNETYLAHHGIKGQKWGIRRYQNADGSLTAEGRKRKGLSAPRRSLKERLAARKAAQEKTPEQAKEELKEYLRKHPKKLPKYGKALTRDDASEIIRNIEFDRKLKDIKQQEIQRSWDNIKTVSNNLQTISNLMTNGKNIYNSYVEINNLLVETGKFKNGKKMQRIGGNQQPQQNPQNSKP